MKKCSLAAALLASSLVASAAFGQEKMLTLERAVELARERAPELQAQAAALDAASERALAAGRLPDPELSLSIDDLPTNGPDAYSFTRDSFTMRRTGVMQSFPNRAKRSADREIAQAAMGVVRANTERVELDLSRIAAEAWINTYVAEQMLVNLNTLRPQLELQAQGVNAAVRAGRASTVDALTAQAAIFDLDDRLLENQREIQSSKAMLTRLIGEDAAQINLADAPSFETLPSERVKLLTNLHQHANVLAYEAKITLARGEVDRAIAERRPDWSAGVSYAFRDGGFSDLVTVEFKVGLPFFTRYRQDPMISAKRAEVAQLDAERDAELRMHGAEVATELARWESARERMDLYRKERLPLARQRTQAALASYQAGALSLANTMASFTAEIDAQRSYLELTRELGRAWAFLRYLEPEGVRR